MAARLPVPAGPLPVAPLVSLDQVVSPGLSLAQLRAILLAYRKPAALLAAALLLLAALVIKLLPSTWAATATVFLDYEINDPLGGREFPLGLLTSYTSTQIEIVKSPQVLLPVVTSLKLDADPAYASGYSGEPGGLDEWLVESLRARLDIQPGVGGQLIYITALARSGAEASRVANAVAREYLGQQVQRSAAPAAEETERYAAQIGELRQRVATAEQRVAEFRKRSGIVEITEDGGVELQLLASLEQRYQEAQNARLAAEAAERSGGAASAASQDLRRTLGGLRAELAELRTTLGRRHPRVLELESRIASIAAALDRDAEADLGVARRLEASLAAATARQRDKVIAVREGQAEGAKLLLELESARAVYKRALDGYDQLRTAAGGRYRNVSLLAEATVPVRPRAPNKLKLLGLAAALAAFLGLALPFLYELLVNRRLRCPDDVERELGVPVLVEFAPAPATTGRRAAP